MSWQNEITRIVRAIINDLDATTYCSSRLEEMIVIAAQLTKNEVELDVTYTTNIGTVTISPDPTNSGSRDDNFINLVALKTACLILNGEVKLAAGGNIRVTDAGASVDLSGQYEATKELAGNICKAYIDAKAAYRMGNLAGIKAILTPYTSSYVNGGIYFG
jgi:hypothetical protein